MKRQTLTLSALALIMSSATPTVAQQTEPASPDAEVTAAQLARRKLSGPRFGFTAFTGEVADRRADAGLEALMTQFGWQLETQIVSASSGNQALMEWVFLVGGVEQSELNLSASWLAGYRMENGFELGVGPNLGWNRDTEKTTTSMIVAGGATMPFGDLFVPLHLAVAMAEGGPRITTLIGWIVG